jgi:hypothetical protein
MKEKSRSNPKGDTPLLQTVVYPMGMCGRRRKGKEGGNEEKERQCRGDGGGRKERGVLSELD